MKLYPNLEESMQSLRRQEVDAFIHTSTIVEYVANQAPCDTLQVGELFAPATWGIPFPKNASADLQELRDAVNQAMLYLIETNAYSRLYNKWFFDLGSCQAEDSNLDASTLDITNLAGLFMLLAGFCCLSIIFVVVERIWARFHPEKPQKSKPRRFVHRCLGADFDDDEEYDENGEEEMSPSGTRKMLPSEPSSPASNSGEESGKVKRKKKRKENV